MRAIKYIIFIVVFLSLSIQCKKENKEIVNNFSIDESIILNTEPYGGELVDIFYQPVVNFTLPIDSVFTDNEGFSYQAYLDSFTISNNGLRLVGETVICEDKTCAYFLPEGHFGINETYQINIYTHYEFLEDGIWKKYENGNLNNEYSGYFETELGNINADKIEYSYPSDRQYHFLKDESITGYLKLKKAENDFIKSKSAGFIAVYSSPGLDDIEVNMDFNENESLFSFPIPGTQLLNETIYKLTFIQLNDIAKEDKIIYELYFRTSMYDTFEEKWDSFTLYGYWSWAVLNGVHDIGVKFEAEEYFDILEISNLVNLRGMTNSDWFQNNVYPLLYEGYPNSGIELDRPEDPLGIPPLNCFITENIPEITISLTNEQINNNSAPRITDITNINITYKIDYYIYMDYFDLRTQIANHPDHETDTWMINLLNTSFPGIYPGYPGYNYYYVSLKYTPIPEITTFETIFSIGY